MSKSLSNRRVAEFLDNHARLLEIAGESSFRARAYNRAADAIRTLEIPVSDLARDDELQSIPGVGEAMAGAIASLLQTGTFAGHESLIQEYPESLLDLATVPGIGAKSVNKLYRNLHVATLEQLAEAATAGTIAATPGLGNRVQKAAIEGLAQLANRTGKIPLGIARTASAMFIAAYSIARPQDTIDETGGIRRWDLLVDALEFLVATDSPAGTAAAILAMPGVESVERVNSHQLAVTFDDGKQGRVYLTSLASWGSDLVSSTGSQAHLTRLGSITNGLASEELVYAAAGLPWIPPELRSSDEAFDRLPEIPGLLTVGDMRGELHAHTTWSDGHATISEMADAARQRGYGFLGITDHSQSLGVANGLNQQRLADQRIELAKVSAAKGLALFAGAEVEVLSDGSLDYPDAVLAELDVVVSSIHGGLRHPRERLVERQVRTLTNPHVDILAHPSGRLLERRDGGDFDWDITFATAADSGVALEINADPARLDLDPDRARRAAAEGCLITINSDAHSADGFDLIEYGVMMARKAWLKPEQVLNTWETDRVRAWLQDRKAIRS